MQLGLTQENLAEKIEMSTSYIGEIERGTSIGSLATLRDRKLFEIDVK